MRPREIKMLVIMLCVLVLTGCGTVTGALPKRTPTPAVTPTTELRIITLVQRAIGKNAASSTTAYDGTAETVNVIATVATFSSASAAQEIVKVLCFHIQEALWTSRISLKQVNVTVEGPVYDIYGDLSISGYGGALLYAGTAAKLAWTTLAPDSAWTAYDAMWLTPTYNND
jgi:hypothetical protein